MPSANTRRKRTPKRRRYNARSFKRHVLYFVVATVVVLVGIVYFAFAKTTVTVTPAIASQSVTFDVAIGSTPTDTTSATPDIVGAFATLTAHGTGSATPTTTGTPTPQRVEGTVTIINTSAKTQTLVETTRLQPATGPLFRTTERIVVPAKSQKDVHVRADDAGTQGEVAAHTRFTVVALWPGLQTQIYGDNAAAFTGGSGAAGTVSQADLTKAQHAALDAAELDARTQWTTTLAASDATRTYTIVTLQRTGFSENVNAKVGDTQSSVTDTVTATYTGIAVPQDAWNTFVQKKVAAQIDHGHRLVQTLATPPTIVVKDSDVKKSTATITATVATQTALTLTNALFEKTHLTNKSRADIQDYFRQFNEIATTDVQFSPFWLVRAPTLPDHVELQLLDPVQKQD